MTSPPQHALVLLSFFLSGFAALTYEMVWMKWLSLHIGHSNFAAAATTAAFLLGLAAGSLTFQFWRPRKSIHPLRLYFWIEISIAILGTLTQYFINGMGNVLTYPGLSSVSLWPQTISWFLASFLVLFPATFLMGTTFPLLIRWWMSQSVTDKSKGPSLLYGVNALGSVLGAGLSGLLLIYKLGLSRTNWLAGIVSLLAAIVVIRWISMPNIHPSASPSAPASPGRATGRDGGRFLDTLNPQLFSFRLHHPILLLVGLAIMICEIAWFRMIPAILGSSIYTYSIILVTYLLGISMGSLIISKAQKHLSSIGLAALIGFLSLWLIISMPLFNRIPYWVTLLFPFVAGRPLLMGASQFIFCSLITLPPSILSGAIFAWILSIHTKNSPIPEIEGAYSYGINTLGSIIGATLAGLILVPRWGAEFTLLTAAWIYALSLVLLAIGSLEFTSQKKIIFAGSFLAIFLAAIYLRPRWDPFILSSGAFMYAPEYSSRNSFRELVEQFHQNQLLFYKDGFSTQIAVIEDPWKDRFLRVNGKTDASWSGVDMGTQLLLGHLPYLLHPGIPQNALVIGFGSGTTSGALSTHKSIKSIDCAEIEPTIFETASFFFPVNREITKNPLFHPISADARHYLAVTSKQYDIITSEPSNPWMAGVANLYTQEAFTLAKNRLSENGIFCQWFHSYSMGEEDFKMILKTFSSVFPHAVLMTAGTRDFFLVGAKRPWTIDYHKIRHTIDNNKELASDLSSLRLQHPFTLLASTFILGHEALREYSQDAILHNDDHPILEYSAPLHLHKGEDALIFANLQAAKKSALPSNIAGLNPSPKEWVLLHNLAGEAFMRVRNLKEANQSFQKALKLDAQDARTWTNLGRVYNILDQHLQSEKAYRKSIALDKQYALPWFHLGMLYLQQGMEEQGSRCLEQGLQRAPGDPMGSLQLGRIYLKKDQKTNAKKIFESALSRPINNPELRNNLIMGLRSMTNPL